MRINDISVSRNHAKLKYNPEDGTILLRDLKSKFGTLILIKNPLQIKEKKIHLQIGRTYIEGWLMGMADFEKLRKEKKNKHAKQQHQNQQHQHQNHENDYMNNPVVNFNNNMDVEEKNDPQSTHYPQK